MALLDFIYLGRFQDLDTIEGAGNIVAENQFALNGQVFNPTQIITLDVTDVGTNFITVDSPQTNPLLFGGKPIQPISYDLGQGRVDTIMDNTVGNVDVLVELADGRTLLRRVAFLQMTNGDLFVGDGPLDGTLSYLAIRSIRVQQVLATAEDRVWYYQEIDGTTLVNAAPPPPPANLAPFFTNVTNGQTISLPENSTFVVDANAADANGDALTFSIIGGADAGRFTINAATGVLAFVTPPDFEGARSAIGNDQLYDVTIRVADGRGGVQDVALFVNVTDVNEAPANAAPVFTNVTNGQTISLPENSTFVVDANAADANGDALTFSIIGGADAGRFTINAATGVLAFVTPPDFEGARSAIGNDQIYDVTIRVADGRGGVQDVALFVNVTDVNEGTGDGTVNGTAGNDFLLPGFTDAQGDQVDGADGLNDRIDVGAGNDTVEYGRGNDTVFGGDGDDFIDDQGGGGFANGDNLIFGGAGNDTIWDSAGNDTVFGDAGNDFIGMDSGGNDSVNGGAGNDTIEGGNGNDTLTVGAGDFVSAGNDADTIIVDPAQLDANGQILANTTVNGGAGGNDADTLDLRNAGNWRIINQVPDGNGNGINGTVQFLDAVGNATGRVLNFTEIETVLGTPFAPSNQPPVFTNVTNGQTISLPENSTFVVDANAADANGDALTFSIIGGADAGRFTINAATGVLAFVTPPDFEGARSAIGNDQLYDVTIRVADGRGGVQDVALFVNVTDVNEAPANAAPVFTNVTNGQTISLPENSTFVVDANATDPNGDALTFSIIGGADAGRFTINAATGVLAFVTPPDFEGARSAIGNDQLYDVTIRVADGRGGVQDVALFVNVTDVNEGTGDGTVNGTAGNDFLLPGFTDAQGDQVDGADGLNDRIDVGAGNDVLDSGLGNDTVDGATGDDLIFGNVGNDSLIGNDGNDTLLGGVGDDTLLGGGGVDSLVGMDGNDSIDGGGANDGLFGGAGSDTLDGGAGNDSLEGGAGDDVLIVGAGDSAVANADADTIIVNRAQLDATGRTTANITVDGGADGADADVLDLRGAGNWRIVNQVQDGNGNGRNGTVQFLDAGGNATGQVLTFTEIETILGTPFNQAPVFTNLTEGQTISVAENTTFVVDANAADPEGSPLTFSIIGGEDAARFVVDPATGVLSFLAAPDFEGQNSVSGDDVYQVTLRVADGLGGQRDVALNVNVTDVNEAPVFTNLTEGQTINVAENTTFVVDANAADPEGNPLTFSIIGGEDAARFVVDPATGVLSFLAAPDFEGQNSASGDDVYQVTLRVADGLGGQRDVALNVNVEDVPEGDGVVDGADTGELMELGYVDASGDEITDSDDSIRGNAGEDTIRADDGNDTVSGGDGNDVIEGAGGNDSVTGDAGEDALFGGDGADSLNGGDGADAIDGGLGNDLLEGGDGQDTVSGGAGRDILNGGAGDDFLNGNDDGDLLRGDEGADFIEAGAGDDTVFGGADGDTIEGGGGSDEVFGGDGFDVIQLGDGDDLAFGEDGDDVINGGAGLDTIRGGEGSDVLSGGDGDDLIDARSSAESPDLLFADLINSDNNQTDDQDLVFGGEGDDVIFTGDDGDEVFGGGGNDLIDSGVDGDFVFGEGGNDTILGNEGGDLIEGGDGDDLIYGGLTPDDTDLFIRPDNNDPIPGNETDTLSGGAGNDTIFGGDDADLITGEEGDDHLFGGIDDDILDGGSGDNVMTGGEGADVFIFTQGSNLTITDFELGDQLNLVDYYNDLVELLDDFADDAVLNQSVGDFSDNAGLNGSITLLGIDSSIFTTDTTGLF